MNKSDLIQILAEKKKLSKKKSEDIINYVFDNMAQSMAKGERIEIRGFGSFITRNYKSYAGRNPRTGQSITVKPKRLPYFKVGRELKIKVDHQDS